MSSDKRIPVAASERNDIDRLMLAWANAFPGIPENVMLIKYEYFAAKTVGMALSSVNGATVTKRYICGGHVAEYNFEVHYQIAPPIASDNKRLTAVEILNEFGEWAESNWPDIGDGRSVLRLQTVSGASYLGATSDLYEDYVIPLKLTYEVNV